MLKPRRAQDKSNTDKLSIRQQVDAIADRFAVNVRRKAEFLEDEQVDALRNELRDYLLERVTRPVAEEWQRQVLRAVELFVVDVHRRPFEGPTRFMIDFETLKWHLGQHSIATNYRRSNSLCVSRSGNGFVSSRGRCLIPAAGRSEVGNIKTAASPRWRPSNSS